MTGTVEGVREGLDLGEAPASKKKPVCIHYFQIKCRHLSLPEKYSSQVGQASLKRLYVNFTKFYYNL